MPPKQAQMKKWSSAAKTMTETALDKAPIVDKENAEVGRKPTQVLSGDVQRQNNGDPHMQDDGSLAFQSEVLQQRFGGAKNVSRARALLQNNAVQHAMEMMKSESARVDAKLLTDFDQVLAGQCVYLPEFICGKSDMSLYDGLKEDLLSYARQKAAEEAATAAAAEEGEPAEPSEEKKEEDVNPFSSTSGSTAIKHVYKTKNNEVTNDDLSSLRKAWSKHQVFENPERISETFNRCIAALAEYFCVDVYATRLNYYGDGTHWKPFHHDSHAYGGRALREDFTMGLSFGTTRGLAFLHEESGRQFNFPQVNGDMFAFTNEVNTRFQHGVPKACGASCGERFSIIAWGRRKELNWRNGGIQRAVAAPNALLEGVREGNRMLSVNDAVSAAQDLVSVRPREKREDSMGSREASSMSASSAGSDAKAKAKKKKNRLQ